MNQLNLMTWYADRELDFCPKHFIPTRTPLSEESRMWIYEKTQGRFYVGAKHSQTHDDIFAFETYPYFEDPQEAVYYELTWS